MRLFRAKGLDIDFENISSLLLSKSQTQQGGERNTGKIKLQDFVQIWNQLDYDLIFANRYDARELCELVDEINQFLVIKLAPENDLHSRTSALFMLLCVCLKQPIRYRRKIRMTIENLKHARQLFEQCKSEGHQDTLFAYSRLCGLKCFKFVYTTDFYGPSLIFQKYLNNFEANYFSTNRLPVTQSERLNAMREENDLTPRSDLSDRLEGYLRDNLLPAYRDLKDLYESYKSLRQSLNLSTPLNSIIRLEQLLEQPKFGNSHTD